MKQNFKIRQKSSSKWLSVNAENKVVLSDTAYIFSVNDIGWITTLMQQQTFRYMDAYTSNNDYRAVTRTGQFNDTQIWLLTSVDPAQDYINSGVYYIQQLETMRYLDAYTYNNDYRVVTRDFQDNDTQEWEKEAGDDNDWKITQVNTGRFLDAHTNSNDYNVVTRPDQNDATQTWVLFGGQTSGNLVWGSNGGMSRLITLESTPNSTYFMKGLENSSVIVDSGTVTDEEEWLCVYPKLRDNGYSESALTIQQRSSGLYLDSDADDNVITSSKNNMDSQLWDIYNA
jgi:hypothetical protein